MGPLVRLSRGHSLLVVGPTQSGKTTSLVIPTVRRWPGPVVVASVKRDVWAGTAPWRERWGQVRALEPASPEGLTFNPLEGVRSHREALDAARDLAHGAAGRATAESEFWNALATKLLGALFAAAVESGGTIYDVVATLEDRRYLEFEFPARAPSVRAALASFRQHEPRTADAVATTAEALLAPWQLPQPLAALDQAVSGDHTLYLVAPRHEQRRYERLFSGVLARLIAAQQRRHDEGTARPLLVVLDEAAQVAPISDLDQLAATGAGLGVTLLTVFQDFAQIEARWGERAATIVNNHATRLVLGGLEDPRAPRYLSALAPAKDERPLREWPRGTAALVVAHRPRCRVHLPRPPRTTEKTTLAH